MLVELIEENGAWVIQDKNGGANWITSITLGTPLAEAGRQKYNKDYVKQAIKLKEAGFSADEIVDLLREAL